MPDKKLTDELLNELLDAPNIDGYIREHDFAAPSLSDYLKQLLQEKGLERSRVVRMADLNETFGYQIFTGAPVRVIRVAIRCCRLPLRWR